MELGGTTSRSIAARLIEGGREPREPVAAVRAAGTPTMRTALFDLGELRSRGCPFPAACVIVIGEVARRVRPIG